MFGRKLCPHCKTGKRSYELDSHSPECPYIYCYNGKKCSMYEKLDEDKGRNVWWSNIKKRLRKNRNGR